MRHTCETFARATLAGALVLGWAAVAAAGDAMPVAQQNELVRTYCGACHDDARVIGGLSLEHFDAGQADPTIVAMLLSKMTNGLTLETVQAADAEPNAQAMLEKEIKGSAIHAAGVPPPDAATIRAWISALSGEAAGATAWTSNPSEAAVATARVVREVPVARDPAKANIYRISVSCRADSREGDIVLTWAPGDLAHGREVSVSADGGPFDSHKLAVRTWRGNRGPTR